LKLGQWCWTRLVHLRDHRLFRVDPTLLFRRVQSTPLVFR
jgi:hypothetical protein